MAGISNLLGLARDGLSAQSLALTVTGQNIANVNTPGFSRRDAVLETRAAGDGAFGGVNAKGIQRAYDQFLDARAYDASGSASYASTRDTSLASVETLVNDSAGTGLSSTMQAMFSSFATLASNPSDPSARLTVLESASKFSQWMHDTASNLTDMRKNLYDQARGKAQEVNDLAAQIATLNDKISSVQATGGEPADLQDQRDKILGDLATRINVRTVIDGGGKVIVSAGGATLVEGSTPSRLSVSLNPDGSLQFLSQRSSGPPVNITTQVTGGTLAGLRDVRDTDIPALSAKLDNLAFDVGTAVNTQHAAGYGLDGQTGRPLFALSASAGGAASAIGIFADLDGHPERVAAAGSPDSVPGGSDNAVALGQVGQLVVASAGTRTPSDAYSDIVAFVGQKKANAAQSVTVRDAMQEQVNNMRQSVTGVSMDEEMVSLSKYQRAYQASAKLLQTADSLLADLMQRL